MEDMIPFLRKLRELHTADYVRFCEAGRQYRNDEQEANVARMVEGYKIDFIDRGKYIAVIRNEGHTKGILEFIVKEDGDKFRRGDILKPKTFTVPVTNYARGNVFDIDPLEVAWTGVR